jgi:hypothetical protein
VLQDEVQLCAILSSGLLVGLDKGAACVVAQWLISLGSFSLLSLGVLLALTHTPVALQPRDSSLAEISAMALSSLLASISGSRLSILSQVVEGLRTLDAEPATLTAIGLRLPDSAPPKAVDSLLRANALHCMLKILSDCAR